MNIRKIIIIASFMPLVGCGGGGDNESAKLEDNVMLEQPLRALEEAENVEAMLQDAVDQRLEDMEE